MYRPEGWEKKKNLGDDILNTDDYLDRVFEAGADAMLGGLRKGATRVNNIGDSPQGKGVIVFIPEEQDATEQG